MKKLIFGTILLALITVASMPAISQAQQLNSMGIPIDDPSKPSPKPQVQQPPKPLVQQPPKPTVQPQKPQVQQPPKPTVQPQKTQEQQPKNSLGL
ncbi:MAG: hypothetical protein CVU52_11675 [Deltaproteobacteria bacterium HGW-Deltaproteobacteria-10]|nr:MAG: hypothetical protein CVU52_11675 [Deltaproteobacteria bacterium HGW-Deltaproteobacteria-10]